MATSLTAANFPGLAESATPASSMAHSGTALPQCNSALATTGDRRRKWLWWLLAIVAASQLYFFRELLAAFAIFATAFVAATFVVVSLYMLVKCGELALARCSALRHPAENLPSVRNISPVGNIAAITRGSQNAA